MLISCSHSGFGNRIKSFASALRLDAHAKVVWERLRDDENVLDNETAQLESFASLFTRADLELPVVVKADCADGIRWNTWRWYVAPGERVCDFTFDRMPEPTKEAYRRIFKTYLQPSPEIVAEAEMRLDGLDPYKTIGVFIRTQNSLKRRQDKPRPRVLFQRIYNTYRRRGPLYVCGDDPSVFEHFAGLDGVTCYPQDDYVLGDWRSAVVNATVMSRLDRLVLSASSTFSEFIYALGGFRQKVDTITRNHQFDFRTLTKAGF